MADEEDGALKEDVTQPDAPDVMEGLTPEEAEVAAKILPRLAESANTAARAIKARELAAEMAAFRVAAEKSLKEAVDEIRKANTPLSPEEVSTLLSQEYVEFKFPLSSNGTSRDFVIKELPIKAEKRLMKAIQTGIVSRVSELARVDWAAGKSWVDQLVPILSAVPGALEALAECAAVVLDPEGIHPEINGDWVQGHIGANRLLNLVNAQVQASHYRDFFSLAYRMWQQSRDRMTI